MPSLVERLRALDAMAQALKAAKPVGQVMGADYEHMLHSKKDYA